MRRTRLEIVATALKTLITEPKRSVLRLATEAHEPERGRAFARSWPATPVATEDRDDVNPLRDYFDANTTGPGIWKWRHYFDAYQRHLAKFAGTRVNVVEVGVYSGGSLTMWRSYLGPGCHAYGVDIEPACEVYASDDVSIVIGDQADRTFWAKFRRDVPEVDVLIDDGGHLPEQQMVTLEEMLPHLRPGGVYICEDIVHVGNRFTEFALGLVQQLNAGAESADPPGVVASPFQRAIHSIHFSPFLMVIEKHVTAPETLISAKHGTEWQPFL